MLILVIFVPSIAASERDVDAAHLFYGGKRRGARIFDHDARPRPDFSSAVRRRSHATGQTEFGAGLRALSGRSAKISGDALPVVAVDTGGR